MLFRSKAFNDAKLKSEREHVTPYIINNSTFNSKSLFVAENFLYHKNWGDERITIDTKEDFTVIEKIIQTLGDKLPFENYIEYLHNSPKLRELNLMTKRGEGYIKSLKEDAK